MSKKKIPQRFGAATLAAATVVSGLAFGPGAAAAPVQSTGSTPVVLPAAEDPRHVVGPLVLQTGASQYTGVYGNTENHPRNGSLFPTLAQARGEATNWSMPAFDGKGEIRSLDRDECIETYGPDQYGVYLRPCTGAANQQWSWIDAHNPFGANTKTLVADSNPERAMLNRNETGTTYLVNRPIDQSKPFVLDDSMVETRELTASVSPGPIPTTVTISGTATPGAMIAAAGGSGVATADGRFSFDVTSIEGYQKIRVTETLSNGVAWGEIDVHAFTGEDFGALTPMETARVEVTRGQSAQVPFFFENASGRNIDGPIDATFVAKAPEGMTFTEGQISSVFRYRMAETGSWGRYGRMDLSDVVLSDDKKTITLTVANDQSKLISGEQYRYMLSMDVDWDAPTEGEVAFSLQNAVTGNAFRVSGQTPVSIPSTFGTVTPVEVPSTELTRDGRTDVSFIVHNAEARSGFGPKVVLTAPEGTTFPDQSTAAARYRESPDGRWTESEALTLRDGVVSGDGRTLTFDSSSNPVSISGNRDYEYTVEVSTPENAADIEDNALGYVYQGTSSAGSFRAIGSAPVSIPGDFGTLRSTAVSPIDVVSGESTMVPLRFENASESNVEGPIDATLTATAPEGTTFTEGQTSAVFEYRPGDSGSWRGYDRMNLSGGVLSEDKKTIVFSVSNGYSNLSAGEQYRYLLSLDVASDAPIGVRGEVAFTMQNSVPGNAFRISGLTPLSIVSAYTDVTLDNPSDGDTFSPGEVEFTGTGTPGATVTVAPSVGAAVVTEVRGDGTWRAVRYLGHANYVMSVSQKAASGENTIENIRLFSNQAATLDFAVTSPVSGAGHTQQGWVTFSGTGTTWSTVSISDGSSVAPTTATVQYDGSWTARRWVGTERTTFTVTSARAGVENGSQSIEFNTGVSGREFTLDSHSDGDTFTPGNVVFRGTGSTGDEVTFSAPGLAPLKATVNAAGEWSIPRWLGNGYITFEVTHTPVVGEPTQQTLRLYSDQVASGPLVVTSPIDGSGHEQQGWVTFSGTGTTWSTVSISDGTGVTPSRATVQYDGSWTVNRWVGTNPVTFTVTSARAGVENGRETIEFNVGDADDDFSFDSHADGGTFTPGNVVFSGKGSTGDKVTMVAPGLAPLEAQVDARGDWRIQRWLGNGFITFEVTHTPVTGAPTQQTLRLFSDQVPQGELVVTSPLDGASHDQAGYVTFTGTGTTWSKVSISDGSNAAPSTATVQYDGSWTVQRWVGTDPVTFTVTSQRADVANGSETIRFNGAE